MNLTQLARDIQNESDVKTFDPTIIIMIITTIISLIQNCRVEPEVVRQRAIKGHPRWKFLVRRKLRKAARKEGVTLTKQEANVLAVKMMERAAQSKVEEMEDLYGSVAQYELQDDTESVLDGKLTEEEVEALVDVEYVEAGEIEPMPYDLDEDAPVDKEE